MVARNPLFSGRFTIKKFNATVINDIWPEVFFFTAVATGEVDPLWIVDIRRRQILMVDPVPLSASRRGRD